MPAWPAPSRWEQEWRGCAAVPYPGELRQAGGKASGSQPGPRSPWRRARPAKEALVAEGGGARTGTWRHRLGLSVTEASKGLDDRRRRLLAGVLLLGQPDIELALCQGEKGRSWKGKPAPSQTKSLVN